MPKNIDEIRVKALIESQTKKVCVKENKTLNYDMLENLLERKNHIQTGI